MRRSIVSLLAWMVSSTAFGQDAPVAPAPEGTEVATQAAPPDPPALLTVETPTVEVPAPTTGSVTGVVTDPGQVPYPGLLIRIGELAVTTDVEGRFTAEMAPGDYLVTVSEPGLYVPGDLVATVSAGSVTTVDIALQSDNPEDYTIIVYAPEVIGGINASIEERKDAPAVTEVIGAEQMSKSGDSNATSALARVTGLTIVNGRFVYVRGMGERYSSTLLNMSTLPSPEPERRVVPLDLFPTGLLDQVTIYKTWTPDLPGEFGGGAVSLKTRGIPDRPFTQITLTGGFVSQTTLLETASGNRSPTDFLGFGLEDRQIPQALAEATADAKLVPADIFGNGYSPEQLEAIGESIDPKYWNPKQTVIPPDLGVQLGIGRRIDLGATQIGVFAGATYTNAWSLDEYSLRDVNANDLTLYEYDFTDLTNSILLGGIGNIGIEFTDDQGIYFTSFLARSSQYQSLLYEGYNNDLGGDLRVNRYDWIERQLLLNQIRGEHTFDNFTIDWRYALSTAKLDEPDQRDYRYDFEDTVGRYQLSTREDAANILYATLNDTNHDGRIDLSLAIGADARPGKISAGGQVVVRERSASTRRFAFADRSPDPALLDAPIEAQFTSDNIAPDVYQLSEVTRPTDQYVAEQQITAGYLMADFPFDTIAHSVWGLRDFAVLAGARVERNETTVTTFELYADPPSEIVATLNNTDVLPSVTFTQNFLKPAQEPDDDTLQLRGGWSRTVTRPDFREQSPAIFNAVFGGREQFGNPDLERGLIDHFDARLEWYPREGELASIGAFYKDFTNPIEAVLVPSATLSQTWANANGARNMGIEFDLRKTLFGTGVGLFDRMYVAANASLTRSRVELTSTGIETDTERPLQGQSPWVVNAQLGYDNGDSKTILTASLNVAGPRIVSVGALGVPNTIEDPVPRLDFLFQQGFARDFFVRLRGRNLLDPNVTLSQGDSLVREGREGWSALLSVEYRP